MKVSAANLPAMDARISVPRYDRSAVRPGILHIGLGNFHRAHLALYCHDLLNAGGDLSWGIRGAGVRAPDAAMRARLKGQDWLFSVSETDGRGLNVQIAGAMVDFVPLADDHAPLIDAIADPVTRIISLTVTEGGYYLDSDGKFDGSHPDILRDRTGGSAPVTVFGAIARGLARRHVAGLPVTVMSCDNIPGNGDVARDAVLGVIAEQDLRDWVQAHVSFPNGMVDRITPATTPAQAATLEADFGLEDAAPVFCEPFRQWVVEDKFAAGRPDWASVGVTFTDHVHLYERMKIRVLNGGHAIIAYPAGLLDIHYVHDAMNDPDIRQLLFATERAEVLPLLATAGLSPEDYLAQCAERFANPGVGDTIARLCFDGSNRQPKFIVPTIAENLAKGKTAPHLAMLSALWARYCFGRTEGGATIAPNDPDWSARQQAARRAETDPVSWLDQDAIYGMVGQDPGFRQAFVAAYRLIADNGVRAALRSLVG